MMMSNAPWSRGRCWRWAQSIHIYVICFVHFKLMWVIDNCAIELRLKATPTPYGASWTSMMLNVKQSHDKLFISSAIERRAKNVRKNNLKIYFGSGGKRDSKPSGKCLWVEADLRNISNDRLPTFLRSSREIPESYQSISWRKMKDVHETCEMISFVYFHELNGTTKESLIIGFTRNTFCLFLQVVWILLWLAILGGGRSSVMAHHCMVVKKPLS